MADFRPAPKKGKGDGEGHPPEPRIPMSEVVEKRCHVCTSDHRRVIDKLLVLPNVSFSEIGRTFNIDRRSIANHAKEHLNYEQAAIRRIIEDEAQKADANVEDGVRGALTRRVFLQAYLQKSMEALLTGNMELSGKDAMAAIQMMDKIDTDVEGAAIDEIRVQFNAFLQAIREICTEQQMKDILARTQVLLDSSQMRDTPQLET